MTAQQSDAFKTYSVAIDGHPVRVMERGEGDPVVFFAGVGGLPSWVPFLDRLAVTRRVIVPSLPGFPGAEAFRHLDTFYEWVLSATQLIERIELSRCDLIGSSVGGALAAEVALLMPRVVRRLALIAPFGLFDPRRPVIDLFAQPPAPDPFPELLCAKPDVFKALWARPADESVEEWAVLRGRSMEAAARFLFPLGDTGLARRLGRIAQPTLLVQGTVDRVMPASYQETLAQGIRGPVRRVRIENAGHLVELDQPDELAREIEAFLAAR